MQAEGWTAGGLTAVLDRKTSEDNFNSSQLHDKRAARRGSMRADKVSATRSSSKHHASRYKLLSDTIISFILTPVHPSPLNSKSFTAHHLFTLLIQKSILIHPAYCLVQIPKSPPTTNSLLDRNPLQTRSLTNTRSVSSGVLVERIEVSLVHLFVLPNEKCADYFKT